MDNDLPLEGLRVLDLSQGIAAPYCGMLLAQNGANVIKVEPPVGDWIRRVGKPYDDQSASAIAANKGKRSIAIDLKQPEGLAIAKRLAGDADVILQNYRPGIIEKFDLDYATVSRENRKVVYLSLTGFGQVGPKSTHPATDSVMQAFSGFMSMNKDRTGSPQRLDYYPIDVITGLYAYEGVSTALYRQATKGKGRHIETSLLEMALAFQESKLIERILEGPVSEPIGALVGTFRTTDGFININARREAHFHALFRRLGREAVITDPKFVDDRVRVENREELDAMLREDVAKMTTAECDALLTELDVLHSPVADHGSIMEHPQVTAIEAIDWVEHGMVGRIPMAKIAGVPEFAKDDPRARAPHVGEHTLDILSEIGLGKDEIALLRAKKAVAVFAPESAEEQSA
jgi:crotonobetainyl-CoA:carnitine CoA-transferase CaiB-like acyl-CoA transferase